MRRNKTLFKKHSVLRGTFVKAAFAAFVLGSSAAWSGCGGGNSTAGGGRSPGRIVYTGSDTEIYDIAPDGKSASRQLTHTRGGGDVVGLSNDASFSPSGGRIVFTTLRNGTPFSQIYVMNADGSDQKQVTPAVTQNPEVHNDPHFHPNGRQIVYVGQGEIRLAGLDGSGARTLVQRTTLDGKARSLVTPTFSPNGQTLAYVDQRTGYGTLFVANADGTGEIPLAGGQRPEFSPDGRQIAFQVREGDTEDVYLINRDGTGRQLLVAGARNPQFSPDGSRIAYNAVADRDRIYVANRDGSQAVALPDTASAQVDDWR